MKPRGENAGRTSRARRWKRAGTCGALSCLAAALIPLVLAAATSERPHTRLEASVPAADSVAETPVTEVRLLFSTAVQRPLSEIELYDPSGEPIRLGPLEEVEGSEGRELRSAVPVPLAAGVHEVRWRTAGPDSHPIDGSFRFMVPEASEARVDSATVINAPQVQTAVPSEAASDPADDGGWSDAISLPALPVRWLHFVTIAFMVGLVGFQRFVVVPAAGRGESGATVASAGLRRWGLIAAGLALFVAMARLGIQYRAIFGSGGSDGGYATLLTASPWGWAWSTHVAAAGVFLAALLLTKSEPRSGFWLVAGVAALVAAASRVAAGHAWAVEGPLRPLALVSDGTHMIAAGLWAGGLGALALVALPVFAKGSHDEPPGDLRAWVAGFSRMALLGVLLLIASGVAHGAIQLGSVGALLESVYGRTLIAKLVLLLGPVALGYYHWRVVRPRLETDPRPSHLSRTAPLELGLALAVLLVAALLVVLHLPE